MPAPVIVRPEPEIRAAAPDAPAEPAPAPGMAVRREPAARPQADDADAANLDGRSRRGLMLVPVLVVVAVAVVLALTGQLERFRGRPEAPATQAVALDAPVPAVIASDSAVVARSDTVPTVQAAGGDSLNAVAVTVPAETTPAATEAPAEQAKSVTPSLDASTTSVVPVAAPKEPAVQVAGSASGPWFIHVSSYTTPEQAAGVASKFAGAGHETSVREHLVNKSMWYRVYLGPYGDRKAAVTLAEEMRSNGSITYYQVQRLEPVATP
jgi:cell division septation protein DedD